MLTMSRVLCFVQSMNKGTRQTEHRAHHLKDRNAANLASQWQIPTTAENEAYETVFCHSEIFTGDLHSWKNTERKPNVKISFTIKEKNI